MTTLKSLEELFYVQNPDFKERTVEVMTFDKEKDWDRFNKINNILNKTRFPSNGEWYKLDAYKEFIKVKTWMRHVPVGKGKANIRFFTNNSGVVLINRDYTFLSIVRFSEKEKERRKRFIEIKKQKEINLISKFTGWVSVDVGSESWSMNERTKNTSKSLLHFTNGKITLNQQKYSLGGENYEYWGGDAYYGYKPCSSSEYIESDIIPESVKPDAFFTKFTRDCNQGQDFTATIRGTNVDLKLMEKILISQIS